MCLAVLAALVIGWMDFKENKVMTNDRQENLSEQDLSEGELVDQEPLVPVKDPASRLAGNNLVPDFGDDTAGTLHESDAQESDV